jgi:hypothetical protein
VLYFEVSLPSPPSYQRHLAQQLDERVIVPYLREAARRRGTRLEGATKVDALLLAPDTGFAVLFEAKALSDISGGVEFDVLRNQIARNIDVMLDRNPRLMWPLNQRNPDRSCFVLMTPEVFRSNRQSRLYGWLYDGYREDPESLQRQLPTGKAPTSRRLSGGSGGRPGKTATTRSQVPARGSLIAPAGRADRVLASGLTGTVPLSARSLGLRS